MNLQQTAEEKFGLQRAEELRSEIVALAQDVEKLRSAVVEIDDEP